MKTYVERIRELREDRDLKQKEVADYLAITQQTYSRYENGDNELPIHHLLRLVEYYGVTSDYILGISDKM